jgi:hypothetical protein
VADALNQKIATSRPERLAQLMHDVLDDTPAAAPTGPATAFQHLLSTPCRKCSVKLPSREGNLSLPAAAMPATVRALLLHPYPPLEALRAVKNLVKGQADAVDNPCRREAGTAVYYLAIAAALVRCGTGITRLGGAELRKGFVWLQSQPWIEEDYKALAEAARKLLEHSAGDQKGVGETGGGVAG